MYSNQYGQVIRSEQEVIELLLQHPNLDITKINFEDAKLVEMFNESAKLCDLELQIHLADDYTALPLTIFDNEFQNNWFIPKDYQTMDIEEFLVNSCPKENYDRVITEIALYKKHNMMQILIMSKYLVDTFRSNNIVWGVGRGSSVASYCLFLIGLHKVDSVKYNLDIGEFLK